MKILWLCNMMLPQIAEHLGKASSPLGGWLVGLMNSLLVQKDLSLVVLFPNGSASMQGNTDEFSFYGFAGMGSVAEFQGILQKEKPDVIHVFGTEYLHSYHMAKAAEQAGMINKTVVNIQGLVSVYAGHYYTKLPAKAIYGTTLRDVWHRNNVCQQKRQFEQRGVYEIKALQMIPHVIGRTDWDKACTEQINPTAQYYFCNETLRDSFYQNQWKREACVPYAIFLSQSNNPVKGFHVMIEAMAEIVKRFPNAHIYTVGNDILNLTMQGKLRQMAYPRYLAKLIRYYRLENHITFLGRLGEQAMCQQYLKAHVFVSASSIENESNSISEAKLLGVPVVSSFVGGVTNRIQHGIDGFAYQHDAAYMLAHYVCRIFSDDTLAVQFSQESKKLAAEILAPEVNLNTMLQIYKEIGQ